MEVALTFQVHINEEEEKASLRESKRHIKGMEKTTSPLEKEVKVRLWRRVNGSPAPKPSITSYLELL